ncbi:hypothetical protein AHAS_Ahas02G0179700 [Arachis hypogaea]
MITLENVVMIFRILTYIMPVSGYTYGNTAGLENEFMMQFGIVPMTGDHKGNDVKFAWLCTIKRSFSWGSTCLAHLYIALCRASYYDYKDMDGSLVWLCVWNWEQLPFLSTVATQQHFSLACR